MRTSSQSGSIFFYIFLGITLFAALGYAISRTGSVKGLSDDKTFLLAQEIIAQGSLLKEAVTRIQLNGYAQNQISFSHAGSYSSSAWVNPNCTVPDCLVFDTAGGGIDPPVIPTQAQVTATNWLFAGTYYVYDAGITSVRSDLVAFAPRITQEVCDQIDKIVGGSMYYRTGNPSLGAFAGNYDNNSPVHIVGSSGGGRQSGCMRIQQPGGLFAGHANNSLYYYTVLIAR